MYPDDLAPWERELLASTRGRFAHLTLAMVIPMLRSIVERFGPDHVGLLNPGEGNGCAYVSGAENYRLIPSCIIGQLFADLGLLRLLLDAQGSIPDDQVMACNLGPLGTDVWEALSEFVTADEDAKNLIGRVQGKQDAGDGWGDALDAAVMELALVKGYQPDTAENFLLRQF
jgi:hypothetical protein